MNGECARYECLRLQRENEIVWEAAERRRETIAKLRAQVEVLIAERDSARSEAEWLRNEEGQRNAQLNQALAGSAICPDHAMARSSCYMMHGIKP